jgi:beta-galactosidase
VPTVPAWDGLVAGELLRVIPLNYFEDYRPGHGARVAPRSRLRTDAASLDLCGEWSFRLWPHAYPEGEVWSPRYDDSAWDKLTVPSHWVLHGDGAYGRPIYTNICYPFPIDPPHVPDDNPTGDYRRRFTVPDDMTWTNAERVLLRFDGVESTYRLWLNGAEVGVGKGSRLMQEFDVSAHVQVGENILVVRVHQWSSASYLEDQDQWWLPGIFREVTLLARPPGHLDDVWLEAGYDDRSGHGRLRVELSASPAAFPITLSVPELALEVRWDDPAGVADTGELDVGSVEPWSADHPRLYAAQVTSTGERIDLRVGFRSVQVDGDRFLVNGRPLVFRGVNRHEVDPEQGRVFDADRARADLLLMKRHNINAIRTSHYPPHPGVLELADELGLWVVDECDLETHGFELVGWRDNPSDDDRWQDAYLDRIRRTVERDKNHACVIMWSLGNESETGRNLAAMSAWVHRRDPHRPVHYEGDRTGEYTNVYSRMYPTPSEVATIGGSTGEIHGCNEAQAARLRSMPFVMCEYAHAMGNGPGSLREYQDLIHELPRVAGGFVWEWRDHGLRARTKDGVAYFAYGGDFGERVHDGNFLLDGLVRSDGTPSPGLAEVAAVFAPVRVELQEAGEPQLVVTNHQHSVATESLRLNWQVDVDGCELARGHDKLPLVEPNGQASIALPADLTTAAAEAGRAAHPSAEIWLTLRLELGQAAPWAPRGHPLSTTQADLSQSRLTGSGGTPRAYLAESPPGSGASPPQAQPGAYRLGSAVIDARTGELVQIGELPIVGPHLELWRATTDNDRGHTPQRESAPALAANAWHERPSSAEQWRTRGLDRLTHRVVDVRPEDDGLSVQKRSIAAGESSGVDTWTQYRFLDDELLVRVDVLPIGTWDCTWPRVGVRLDLPAVWDKVGWFGAGPMPSYPDSCDAAIVGRHESAVDELEYHYDFPQENGHRADLRTLELSGEATHLQLRTFTVAVSARTPRRPGFTLSRHTSHEIEAAAHPHELPASGSHYLYLDAAQHGLGSRSCGPDVLPEHRLWPRRATILFGLRLRTGLPRRAP